MWILGICLVWLYVVGCMTVYGALTASYVTGWQTWLVTFLWPVMIPILFVAQMVGPF